MIKYEGYTVSQLGGICKTGNEQDSSDALQEIAWREFMSAYDAGVMAQGILINPLITQGGRPNDRNPPPPPPPRPGSGGGGGGSWELIIDNSAIDNYIFVP